MVWAPVALGCTVPALLWPGVGSALGCSGSPQHQAPRTRMEHVPGSSRSGQQHGSGVCGGRGTQGSLWLALSGLGPSRLCEGLVQELTLVVCVPCRYLGAFLEILHPSLPERSGGSMRLMDGIL